MTRGARISESDLGEVHYNLACAYSRAGKTRDAVGSLSRAIKLLPAGSMVDQLDGDRDLDPLRNDADFRRMLADARIARERLNRKRAP